MIDQSYVFKYNLGTYIKIITRYLISECNWVQRPVRDCIDNLSFTIPNKLPTKEYLKVGKYPVISQGQAFIEAYTDDEKNLITEELPLIIFGDHTKNIKFVDFPFVLGADGVKLIKPKKEYLPKFLFYLLHGIDLPDKSYSRHYKYLCNAKIAFPPNNCTIKLQESICEFLDLLSINEYSKDIWFSDVIETKIKSLQRLSIQINTLKSLNNIQIKFISSLHQSILQEAIEGKLTADWRKQNPVCKGDPNTDAAALLEKIKLEKEKMIAEGKIKKEKPLEPIKLVEIPFELPEGWVWCRLGDMSLSIVYGTSQKCSYDETQNSKVLRIPNISKGYIETTDIKYSNLNDKEKQELSLIHGDVLVIRSNGSPEIVGTMVFVTEEFFGFCFAGYLIRFRFCLPIIGEYISLISKSRQIRNQIENPLRTTVGINNVNTQELSNLLIPLPPLSEQQAIVSQVNKLVFMVGELEEQVNLRKRLVKELIQAVLREVFEGKT